MMTQTQNQSVSVKCIGTALLNAGPTPAPRAQLYKPPLQIRNVMKKVTVNKKGFLLFLLTVTCRM